MKQKFLSNLLLIVVLNLLVKPFYILGIDAEVQNRVGEAVYGNYFSLLNFSFLLNILLDFGITNFNTRNIAQSPQLITKHFYKILSLRFLLFFLYASFTLATGFLVGYSEQEFYLLVILMFNQFLVAIIQFSRSNFAGLHLFKTDSFISILDRSLLIIICSALLWTNVMGTDFKIEWFVYAQTLAYGLSAIISVSLLFSKVGRIKIGIKKHFSMVIIKRSFPYALLILLMMMYSRIDAVMLERILPNGNEQAGVYAQGFRFLDAVNMFALLFAGLLLPIFSRLLKQGKSVQEMMELSFRILIGVGVIVGVTAFFFSDYLIGLRYPDSTALSAETFSFLILSFIPVCITYIFGTLLTANGSLKALNIMAFSGVLLNITLNLIMIPIFEAKGAALATLITQIATALIQVILVYKILKLEINYKMFISVIALVAALSSLFMLLSQSMTIGFTFLLCLFASGVIFAFLLKIFRISDFKQMMKKGSLPGKEE